MNDAPIPSTSAGERRLRNACGLELEWLWHGGLRHLRWQDLTVNLFPGTAAEAGPANLWLRRLQADGSVVEAVPLLGPQGVLGDLEATPAWDDDAPRARGSADGTRIAEPVAPVALARGVRAGLDIQLRLVLSPDQPTLAWQLQITNVSTQQQSFDLLVLQDIGLSHWGAIRLNEFYVSQYVDLQPLEHPQAGWMLAARQNQPVEGRHPRGLMGSLGRAVSLATDAWQWCGTALRTGEAPPALRDGLPGTRLQHEHAAIALQEARVMLAPGAAWQGGFFLLLQAHHGAASGPADLPAADAARAAWRADLAQWRAAAASTAAAAEASPPARRASLFATAPWLEAQDLSPADIDRRWPGPQRHAERTEDGALLSFFTADGRHVVLRAKEQAVRRPHGHLLRAGRHLVPDETALTSTVWMAGGFHSMLTQGHVGINRCLGTVRSALGLFRGQGQRVFVRPDGGAWAQLGLPSAFEIGDDRCRWWYRHAGGLLVVDAWAEHDPQAMGLALTVEEGPPLNWRVSHDIALGDEDHVPPRPLPWQPQVDVVTVAVPPGSPLAARFPQGRLLIVPEGGLADVRVAGDAALYPDGRGHGEPYVVLDRTACSRFVLRLVPQLVDAPAVRADRLPLPRWSVDPAVAPSEACAAAAQRLADIVPWFAHDALVHYLSPRGLEQFSGGGWGTRDVCQGPLEMLLALDRPAAVRDLLCRVFSAQDPGGDWPQWFMFFDRERHIRAGDAHGDIVFWPLLGLARYLVHTGDASLLDQPLPYHAGPGETATVEPLWRHVQRARTVVHGRQLPGTRLVSYGHGDWNDSLQPADPALRDRLCSSWTVTLHHQVLTTLARGLQACGRGDAVAALRDEAAAVQADFRRLLLRDGTVAGYALFDGPPGKAPELLLHPADTRTGLRHSLLPLMHAVLEDLLTPEEARGQLTLIERHLTGPDGARLFDRPLDYHGGPQRLFQRAESSAFFGREIGAMYMHAHLRYAEMLAHLGEAQRLFDALQRIHPIGLQAVVPQATRRQANCYYSSSDAAFADRYEASAQYGRIADGTVPLDGGWRVYSSGPGLALSLLVGGFLGLRRAGPDLLVDPVMPPALDGLQARVTVDGLVLALRYRPGPRGHGPQALRVAGDALSPEATSRLPHAYRLGGLRLPLRLLHARARGGEVALEIATA